MGSLPHVRRSPAGSVASAGADADVVLQDVGLDYGTRRVLDGLSARFAHGRITVILGGSGTGKTTLLRLLGGLLAPTRGTVRVLGRELGGLSERQLFGVRAELGMMFQNGALLDSRSVYENVALPLVEHARLAPADVERAVSDVLDSVGLAGTAELFPRQLSGGMTKRVALARALIRSPRVLLCDEPFSGLDPISARRIEGLLTRVRDERGITVIVVSHDIDSTLRMADYVLLLLPGGAFFGTPGELRASSDERVARFLRAEAGNEEDQVEPAGNPERRTS